MTDDFLRDVRTLKGKCWLAGCKPGTLKLIVLTRGDSDHSGNCAYLREKYGAKVATHDGDRRIVEYGDLFGDRHLNFFVKAMGNAIVF